MAEMTLDDVAADMRAYSLENGASFSADECAQIARLIDAAIKQREHVMRYGVGALESLDATRITDSQRMKFLLDSADAEVAELRAVCAATYQAAGCYGLPVRFLDALSNAMHGEKLHKVDLDKLLPVAPVDWVERAERAEAELAALKARIAGAPIIHAEKTWRGTLFMNLSQHDVDLLDGKRVRLVVEE